LKTSALVPEPELYTAFLAGAVFSARVGVPVTVTFSLKLTVIGMTVPAL